MVMVGVPAPARYEWPFPAGVRHVESLPYTTRYIGIRVLSAPPGSTGRSKVKVTVAALRSPAADMRVGAPGGTEVGGGGGGREPNVGMAVQGWASFGVPPVTPLTRPDAMVT